MNTRPRLIRNALTESFPAEKECCFPNFLALARVNVLQKPRNLEARPFLALLAVKIASGGTLSIFDKGRGLPVVTMVGDARKRREDLMMLGQLLDDERQEDPALEQAAMHRLWQVYQPTSGEAYIDSEEGQASLDPHVPDGAVLMIWDLDRWCSEPALSDTSVTAAMAWMIRLTERGVTVVLVEDDPLDECSFGSHVEPDELTRFSPARLVPHQSGGSFTIERAKSSIYQKGPLRSTFWYIVQKSKLRWGLQLRDENDDGGHTRKQAEIVLRDARAEEYLRRNPKAKQIELASHLGISPATAHRTMRRLRENGGGN